MLTAKKGGVEYKMEEERIGLEQACKELGFSSVIGFGGYSIYCKWDGMNRDSFRNLLNKQQARLHELIHEVEKGCWSCPEPTTVSEAAYQSKVAEAIATIRSRKL